MRLKLLLFGALLIAALVIAVVLNTPAYRATVTNMTGYCRDVDPQLQRIAGAERHIYRQTPRRNLYLHVFRPPPGKSSGTAIMLLFGGAWREGRITAFEPMAHRLAQDGHVVILPDYRVRCRDDSSIRDSISDSSAAYAWVQRQEDLLGIDSGRIVVGGESAGGHLALMTVLDGTDARRPAALLLFNPVVDLAPMSTQLRIDRPTATGLSPQAKPLHALPPILILHGTADSRVPIGSVRRFCAAAGRSCQLQEYAGQEHGFFHSTRRGAGEEPSAFDKAAQRVRRFLSEQALAPLAMRSGFYTEYRGLASA